MLQFVAWHCVAVVLQCVAVLSHIWLIHVTTYMTHICDNLSRDIVLQLCCSVLQCCHTYDSYMWQLIWLMYVTICRVTLCCSVLSLMYVNRRVHVWHYSSRRDMQCIAVCCSVLQCVAVCCSVLQCLAVCCSLMSSVTRPMTHWLLQCVAACVLQCVAVCSSALQCVAVSCHQSHDPWLTDCVAVCCSCCSVLRCVAVGCRVLQSYIYSHTTHDWLTVLQWAAVCCSV